MGKSDVAERLTEVELEIMNVVWDMGPATIRQVHETINQERPLAYTSVATMMKILEQKEVLLAKKDKNVIVYHPRLQRQTYQKRSLQHVVDQVYGGAPEAMVMHLLDTKRLTEAELNRISKLIKQEKSR